MLLCIPTIIVWFMRNEIDDLCGACCHRKDSGIPILPFVGCVQSYHDVIDYQVWGRKFVFSGI